MRNKNIAKNCSVLQQFAVHFSCFFLYKSNTVGFFLYKYVYALVCVCGSTPLLSPNVNGSFNISKFAADTNVLP